MSFIKYCMDCKKEIIVRKESSLKTLSRCRICASRYFHTLDKKFEKECSECHKIYKVLNNPKNKTGVCLSCVSKAISYKRRGWGHYNEDFKNEHPEEYAKQRKYSGHLAGIAMHLKYPELAKQFGEKYGSKGGKAANEVHKKNKTGFYNSELQSELGKKGGVKGGRVTSNRYGGYFAINRYWKTEEGKKHRSQISKLAVQKTISILRNKKNFEYNGILFDSGLEMRIGIALEKAKLINKLEDGVSCHIKIKNIEIDFKLNDGTFLEFHYFGYKIVGGRCKTKEEYYDWRRKILDENGFINNILLVFDTQNEIYNFIKQRSERLDHESQIS